MVESKCIRVVTARVDLGTDLRSTWEVEGPVVEGRLPWRAVDGDPADRDARVFEVCAAWHQSLG